MPEDKKCEGCYWWRLIVSFDVNGTDKGTCCACGPKNFRTTRADWFCPTHKKAGEKCH